MADNIQVKDAAGATKTMRTSDNGVAHTPHQLAFVRGAPADFAPAYSGASSAVERPVAIDEAGAVVVRGQALTDEGTFRINFANSSLAVSIGSVSVSGAVVTGTGFLTADVHLNDYFKLDADAESAWLQIESIDSDTQLTLVSAYVGGSSGAASRALVQPYTGSGGSLAVASGQLTINSGTTNNAATGVDRLVDYSPLIYRSRLSLSQRIANQDAFVGLVDPSATPKWFARFRFDGTTNTSIKCETGRNPTGAPSASETETTVVTLPNGVTTATLRDYRVELLTESVRFYIDGVLVAEHSRVIPAQHDPMAAYNEIRNGTGAASTTAMVVDYITAKNHNKLEIGVLSDYEKIVAANIAPTLFSYNVAGVIAINTDLLIIDCAQFRSLSIQAISIGTTGVVTPAWSNDLTNWQNATISTQAGATATTFNAAGLWVTPIFARYLRLRLTTATTAGTTTLAVQGFNTPIAVPSQSVQGSVSLTGTLPAIVGQTAEDSAVTGNPVRIGGTAATALPATTIVNGDALSLRMSTSGQVIQKQFAAGDLDFNAQLTVTTNTQTAIRAAQGASIRQNVTEITYQNTNATATTLTIQDGNTTLRTISVPASMSEPRQLIFPTPLRGTANTALNYTAGTTGANILLGVAGYNSY